MFWVRNRPSPLARLDGFVLALESPLHAAIALRALLVAFFLLLFARVKVRYKSKNTLNAINLPVNAAYVPDKRKMVSK